ncbi:dynamin family protein [Arcobacter lacus]|uniref:dynamin family protein n=1 Tax=Arcobacter lacus TaxID=1912876 RepID=UPI0021BAF0DF|nr:dynamin family protein [Arcobacter lacus]MCT7909253.1 dynamin family protein [Arcobacter lacus]
MENIDIENKIYEILDELKNKIKRENEANGIQNKIKLLKDNMLNTLEASKKIANLAKSEAIGEVTSSIKSMEKEQEEIKKEVLTFAVFGQMSAGKSSFLNTIAREKLLNVSEQRTTSTISIIRHIENFSGYKNGDIEVSYKSKQRILEEIQSSINRFNEYSDNNIVSPDTMESFLENRDKTLEIISKGDTYTEIDRKYRNEAKGIGKKLEYFLIGVEDYRNKIDENKKIDKLSNELIDDKKSVFIEKVTFYKDIEFLKGIELVDTPGLGSNNNLHTNTSEEFIKKADVVIILTDAKEPMQKESELDILHILEDIDKKNKKDNNLKKTIFEKVFIVINKIDSTESNRGEILKILNNELKENHILNIPDDNKLFISALYEFQKEILKDGLDNLKLYNRENIGDDDLGILEKRIYTFASQEMTEIFINDKIYNIQTILNKTIEYFNNSIEDLKNKVKEAEKGIDAEKKSQENTKEMAEDDFLRDIKHIEAGLSGKLKEKLIDNINFYGTEEYFEKNTDKNRWKNINNNISKENKENRFKELAKEESIGFINKIIYVLKEDYKKIIKESEISANSMLNTYIDELKKVIKKENNIDISYTIIEPFESIDMHFDDIDERLFERNDFKKFKQFINPKLWGEVAKQIENASEKYCEICNSNFKSNMDIEVTNITKSFIEGVKSQKEEIKKDIDEALKIQLDEKERYKIMTEEEQKNHIKAKESINQSFKDIEERYIEQIKNQKDIIFKKDKK